MKSFPPLLRFKQLQPLSVVEIISAAKDKGMPSASSFTSGDNTKGRAW
ncbi:MAG TPA: hypothetical protein VG097_19615 [Gemmata sp.]|nr:hypothetical protein [Gemmata sp.]